MTQSETTATDSALGASTSPVVGTSGANVGPEPSAEITGYFDAYATFARTLRTWLVGFGVGVPVVVASQADLATKLTASGNAKPVVGLFLVGVSVQIVVTMLYKSAMWYTYYGSMKPSFQRSKRYKWSEWISEQHWLEVGFDTTTMALFVWAVFVLLSALFA